MPDDDDKLAIGARAIAKKGFDDQIDARAVYRLFETDPGWPVFKLAGKWTGRPKAIKLKFDVVSNEASSTTNRPRPPD